MSGSDESASLSCSLKISFLDTKGTPIRQVSNAKSYLILGRNEFKDIIVKIQCGTSNLSFGMKNIELHTRFVKEGKATITLPSLQIFISNCPTAKLKMFLKTLMVKVERLKGVKAVGLKERLLSNKAATFQEISPLTNLDVNVMKSRARGCPLTPTSSKRKQTLERPLSVSEERVLGAVLAGRSVFFTGAAGTGKSFLLQRVLGALPPDATFATASTGVAACHIGGMTLHAFASAGDLWRRCRHLVVDEVSMVDGRFFSQLEATARRERRSERPFGGIQLILSGDFLQLPPVAKERIFCFQTPAWEKCIDVTIELSQVKRQKDEKFIEILHNVRRGRLSASMLETLKATAKHQLDRDGILPTKLSTHKDDVELINRTHLTQLPGEARTYVAEDNIPSMSAFISRHCHVGNQLELKVGCQVMLTKNLDVPRGLVNGARGVVTGFTGKERGLPVVQFACGVRDQEVRFERWSFKAPNGQVLTRRMIPLQLAWAMSIHKSQGMTLDCVEVSLGRVFECGQAYVALSRARSLEGLRVLDIRPSSVRADPAVLHFYDSLK